VRDRYLSRVPVNDLGEAEARIREESAPSIAPRRADGGIANDIELPVGVSRD